MSRADQCAPSDRLHSSGVTRHLAARILQTETAATITPMPLPSVAASAPASSPAAAFGNCLCHNIVSVAVPKPLVHLSRPSRCLCPCGCAWTVPVALTACMEGISRSRPMRAAASSTCMSLMATARAPASFAQEMDLFACRAGSCG